jgi:Mrp family chromosome partitioning ATPase
MSRLYEVLQTAHRGRSAVTNEPNDQTTPSAFPHLSASSRATVSIPRFHEESELHALAQNIATRLPNPDQNVIQFIGTQAGEGTSTLIREFALTLGRQSSKPILLVEADFRQPSQAQAFALKEKPSLNYAIREGKPLDGVVSKIEQSNLFLGTLSSEFFRSLTERSFFRSTDMWKALRSQFSLILIDSSPVNTSADGLAICEYVNGVVLVLAAEKTRAAVAQNVKREILRREGNLLGIVYTKRKFHIPKSMYQFV